MSIYYIDSFSGSNTRAGTSWATSLRDFRGFTTMGITIVAGDEIRFKKNATYSSTSAWWGDTSETMTHTIMDRNGVTTSATWVGVNGNTGIASGVRLTAGTKTAGTRLAYITGSFSTGTSWTAYAHLAGTFLSSLSTDIKNVIEVCLCTDTAGNTPGPVIPIDKSVTTPLGIGMQIFSAVYNTTIRSIMMRVGTAGSIVATANQTILFGGAQLSLTSSSSSNYYTIPCLMKVPATESLWRGRHLPFNVNDAYFKVDVGNTFVQYTDTLTILRFPWEGSLFGSYRYNINFTGTSGNPVKITGGWDSTTGLQDGVSAIGERFVIGSDITSELSGKMFSVSSTSYLKNLYIDNFVVPGAVFALTASQSSTNLDVSGLVLNRIYNTSGRSGIFLKNSDTEIPSVSNLTISNSVVGAIGFNKSIVFSSAHSTVSNVIFTSSSMVARSCYNTKFVNASGSLDFTTSCTNQLAVQNVSFFNSVFSNLTLSPSYFNLTPPGDVSSNNIEVALDNTSISNLTITSSTPLYLDKVRGLTLSTVVGSVPLSITSDDYTSVSPLWNVFLSSFSYSGELILIDCARVKVLNAISFSSLNVQCDSFYGDEFLLQSCILPSLECNVRDYSLMKVDSSTFSYLTFTGFTTSYISNNSSIDTVALTGAGTSYVSSLTSFTFYLWYGSLYVTDSTLSNLTYPGSSVQCSEYSHLDINNSTVNLYLQLNWTSSLAYSLIRNSQGFITSNFPATDVFVENFTGSLIGSSFIVYTWNVGTDLVPLEYSGSEFYDIVSSLPTDQDIFTHSGSVPISSDPSYFHTFRNSPSLSHYPTPGNRPNRCFYTVEYSDALKECPIYSFLPITRYLSGGVAHIHVSSLYYQSFYYKLCSVYFPVHAIGSVVTVKLSVLPLLVSSYYQALGFIRFHGFGSALKGGSITKFSIIECFIKNHVSVSFRISEEGWIDLSCQVFGFYDVTISDLEVFV